MCRGRCINNIPIRRVQCIKDACGVLWNSLLNTLVSNCNRIRWG